MVYQKARPLGAVSGLFLIGYGTFRFLVEFVREPDVQLGLFGDESPWDKFIYADDYLRNDINGMGVSTPNVSR
ncbi:prolipoprotein diacylglyceryl transferase family protein [Vibrio metschnikovii]